MDLLLSFIREDGGTAVLQDIGNAVGLGGAVPDPHGIEIHAAAFQRLRNDRVAEAGAGETGGLGQGADLDGACFRTGNLKDAVGKIFFYKGFIGGIEEDHRTAFIGPVDPLGQLFPVVSGTGGIVRGAQIDQIRIQPRLRQGQEMIIRAGGKMNNLPAGHGVGVHIGGISRLHDQSLV